MTETIKGEGEFQLVRRVRVRIECDNCGEPADRRHTYLLSNARNNPQSSGYRKDDISWCCDKELFSCAECRKKWSYSRPLTPDGYSECSTFGLTDFKTGAVSERFAHMFLTWKEKDITETLVGHVARIQSLATRPPDIEQAARLVEAIRDGRFRSSQSPFEAPAAFSESD